MFMLHPFMASGVYLILNLRLFLNYSPSNPLLYIFSFLLKYPPFCYFGYHLGCSYIAY